MIKFFKKIFHKHKWINFLDNIKGECGITFTLSTSHCEKCSKYKINFIYGHIPKGISSDGN